MVRHINSDERNVDWDAWKEYNRSGYDVRITFLVEGNSITIEIENGGIVIRDTVTANTDGKRIFAALTGDQVALTGIGLSVIRSFP